MRGYTTKCKSIKWLQVEELMALEEERRADGREDAWRGKVKAHTLYIVLDTCQSILYAAHAVLGKG